MNSEIWPSGRKKSSSRKVKRRNTEILEFVSEIVSENSFCSLDDIVKRLKEKGVRVSRATACRAVRSAGFTRKRARSKVCGKEPKPEDADLYLQGLSNKPEIISVDETCVYLEESPRYGYSLKGTRCVHNRRNASRRSGKVSLLLAISNIRGVVAHSVVKGSFRASSFADFVRSIPNDGKAKKGCETPVILDNVSFHKSYVARSAAAENGMRFVFIPPYSPDFNPVENAFSVLKQAMRRGDELADALASITTPKCSAFFTRAFRHATGIRDGVQFVEPGV